ncbi:AAA family ATPase [Aminivibrio sp.]|jgi:DNA repair protein RecN (Recombination protein N)|uniref:AAA family ATPase n=1 Tax=Aminivibrio sp. TaxID=1872489 RepID=UPI001A463603|nr:AAA family ATPase [Aminivibrio sp.]MBL3538929.1 AAA family ATPase [Aminivibrio sp.]MDK2958217.1 repair protein RecN [Synergistaceae bacterium]
MIEEVTIRNVGGVASATLRFDRGLTVITGESGAGKSSLVRSLELLGGKRSQSAFLRSGEEEGSVEAVLAGISAERAGGAYMEEGDGSVLFARRTFSRSGKNRTFFQGRAVPLSTFSAVMNEEMRIQSQFAQIELLDPKRQMEILDFCGGDEISALKEALSRTFTGAVECDRSLRAAKSRELDLKTRFRDGEAILSAAKGLKLSPGCEGAWESQIQNLSLRLDTLKKSRENVLKITGGAAGQGLLDLLESSGLDLLRTIEDDEGRLGKLFNEGLERLQVFAREAARMTAGQSIEEMEKERDLLEKKTGILRKLKRATGTASVEDFLFWCEEAKTASEWMREQERLSSELTEKGRALRKEAVRLAAELRALRAEAASKLETEVNRHLSGLAMEDCRFSVRLSELEKIRSTGADDVSFTLSAGGRGEIPVNKTASGGELSRILLALQLSLPATSLPPTLVFDEVEAGLGGRAAVLAGYKLQDLSRRCQVILVTHEATIAALAEHHYVVRKNGESVEAVRLGDEERAAEIARMLSGDSRLPEAIEHAKKLLSGRLES